MRVICDSLLVNVVGETRVYRLPQREDRHKKVEQFSTRRKGRSG
jgi:hypothetical protein